MNGIGSTKRVNWSPLPGRADLVESRMRENRTSGSGRQGARQPPPDLHCLCSRDFSRPEPDVPIKNNLGRQSCPNKQLLGLFQVGRGGPPEAELRPPRFRPLR